MALKKCAAEGMPASTTAIMNKECEPTDCPAPLMKGWSYGTTNDAASMEQVYRVTILKLIFREAIFILSELESDLLSAAVAAKMSIPTYEKITLTIPVLERSISQNWAREER